MLASSFLSAEALSIPQEWRDALIEVLHRLEAGELVHIHEGDMKYIYGQHPPQKTMWFNMAHWTAQASCGSIFCIGGAAEEIGGFRFRRCDGDITDDRLYRLFYPLHIELNHITPERAARTLRRFLETGRVSWAKKLKAK